jgi:hypothetical protein
MPLKVTNLGKRIPLLGDWIHSHWCLNFRAHDHFKLHKVMNAAQLKLLGNGLILVLHYMFRSVKDHIYNSGPIRLHYLVVR